MMPPGATLCSLEARADALLDPWENKLTPMDEDRFETLQLLSSRALVELQIIG